VHFKHPSTLRSMSQKIMILLHHKLGNFILFKLCMEPSVFSIAIKRNKQKYGAISMVAMTTSKQCIVVPWKILYLCNNQIASLAQFIDTCFYKEKKCPILILQLIYWFTFFWHHYKLIDVFLTQLQIYLLLSDTATNWLMYICYRYKLIYIFRIKLYMYHVFPQYRGDM
jgi:hypothetical protein